MSDDSDNGPFTDSDTGISTDAVFTTGQLSPSVGGNTSSGSQAGSDSSPPFPPFTPPPPRRELTRIPDRDLPHMDPMDQYRRNFNLPTVPPDGYGSSGSSPESQRHAGSNAAAGSPAGRPGGSRDLPPTGNHRPDSPPESLYSTGASSGYPTSPLSSPSRSVVSSQYAVSPTPSAANTPRSPTSPSPVNPQTRPTALPQPLSPEYRSFLHMQSPPGSASFLEMHSTPGSSPPMTPPPGRPTFGAAGASDPLGRGRSGAGHPGPGVLPGSRPDGQVIQPVQGGFQPFSGALDPPAAHNRTQSTPTHGNDPVYSLRQRALTGESHLPEAKASPAKKQ